MLPKNNSSRDSPAAWGLAPDQWETRFTRALDSHDHARLRKLLDELRSEIRTETGLLHQGDSRPILHRLVEQTRRLLRAEPGTLESLESELEQERDLWSDYRKRYRNSFIPSHLHPYLKSCSVFLAPSRKGVQYRGFDKYTGHRSGRLGEAITLFSPDSPACSGKGWTGTPPNFFSSFKRQTGEFIVLRAFRTGLPRGSGLACIMEHVRTLVPEPGMLERITFDNVQNRPTYEACVASEGNGPRPIPGARALDTPLGRLGKRILDELSIPLHRIHTSLDPYGMLDLTLFVSRRGHNEP